MLESSEHKLEELETEDSEATQLPELLKNAPLGLDELEESHTS